MNHKEYLLVQAASECNEVAHRITKALHFGLDEVQPGQPLTNAERIAGELLDLFATLEMLEDEGMISNPCDPGAVRAKKEKVRKFMAYAQECGTLLPNTPISGGTSATNAG